MMTPSHAAARSAARATTPPRVPALLPPVLVVTGGKVGVGASTIAAGLATSFAATRRTLLVDADEAFVSLHDMLGVECATHAGDLLNGMPPERVLSPAGERLVLVAGRPTALPALSSAQRSTLFLHYESLYRQFDVVVVDAGSRAATVLAACAAESAAALIVTTGDRIAAAGAYALEKLLHLEHPRTPADVIVNMQDDADAFFTRELLGGATQQFLGRPLEYAGSVPHDPALAVLLGGKSPEPATGHPHFSPGLVALTEIGTRALTTVRAPTVRLHSSSTFRPTHGTR